MRAADCRSAATAAFSCWFVGCKGGGAGSFRFAVVWRWGSHEVSRIKARITIESCFMASGYEQFEPHFRREVGASGNELLRIECCNREMQQPQPTITQSTLK